MIKLAAQRTGFLETCRNLLNRMIETVPKGVDLSDVIVPQAVKPVNATLDPDPSGNLIFSGSIRVGLPYICEPISDVLTDPIRIYRHITPIHQAQLQWSNVNDSQTRH
jgi:hypothetical protein